MPPKAECGEATEGQASAESSEAKAGGESGVGGAATAGDAAGHGPSRGRAREAEAGAAEAAEGQASSGKGTGDGAADGKPHESQTGYVLIEDGTVVGLVLADGTRVMLPSEDLGSVEEPRVSGCVEESSVGVRTGAVCANGEPFTMAPRKKRAVDTGAALAQEYFGPISTEADAPPAKRLRRDPAAEAAFAQVLLEKAPGPVQTCHSLLQFLAKKLEAPLPKTPEYDGPKDLQKLLLAHADQAGRVAALKDGSNWDARARRILDVPAAAASELGAAEVAKAGQRVEDSETVLDQELKERGEVGVRKLLKEHVAWSKECIRREWFGWCARLLRAREASLLAGGKAPKAATALPPGRVSRQDPVDVMHVLRALLQGSVVEG